MFFHPGGGMATSTYLSAPPPEQYERALQGHRTRRTLCDVPVSVPNTDELYCSIPKIKVNRPKGPPAKKNILPGLPVRQVPVYQVYQEDQDQISDATYISEFVFTQCVIRILAIRSKRALTSPLQASSGWQILKREEKLNKMLLRKLSNHDFFSFSNCSYSSFSQFGYYLVNFGLFNLI